MSENVLLTTVPTPDGFWDEVEPDLVRAIFLELAEQFCGSDPRPVWMTRVVSRYGRIDYLVRPEIVIGFRYEATKPLHHSARAVSYYRQHVAEEITTHRRIHLDLQGALLRGGTAPLPHWDPYEGLLND